MRRVSREDGRIAAAIAVACCSCQSVAPPAGLAAPINACPAEDCTAYLSTADAPVACVAGACVVAHAAQNLVMVISLAQDTGFAPGRTFAVSYDELRTTPAVMTPAGECDAGQCAALHDVGISAGQYLVLPSVAQPFPLGVGWYLGNPSLTGLPVQATYRLQWPVPGSTTATVDAESLGLPVPPVQAVTSFNPYVSGPPPGSQSAGSGGIIYQAYLQAGVYERIMTPTAPFDQAFPPDVQVLPVVPEATVIVDKTPISLDSTVQEVGLPATIPVFDITSLAGPMDGWTAYLRDNTGLTISNVAALHGTETPQVVLATAHAGGGDALQNASLVIAPPPGGAMPTFVPIGNDLPAIETYPPLPAPVTVIGKVMTTSGSPVPAQIVFEALAITVTTPQGTNVPNTSNFEFAKIADATVDDASGAAGYSVVLPRGSYQVSVRPLTTESEVTIVTSVVVDGSSDRPVDFTVDVQRTAQGTAIVADGRPLAGATIDLLPIGCIDGTKGTPTGCLPRPRQAPTANDGSFQLAVDPGKFFLRVKPADGSRLPWVVQPFAMAAGSTPIVIPPITVPAPTPVGLSLFDPGGNALINAVVRAFWLPNQGTAYELGNAITGVDGHYDMYLAIPSQ